MTLIAELPDNRTSGIPTFEHLNSRFRGLNDVKAAAADFTHNLRFPGQIFDPRQPLQQRLPRLFPALGRYVESDPIGLAGGVNTYAYAGNNPVASPIPWAERRSVAMRRVDFNFIQVHFSVSPTWAESSAPERGSYKTSTSGQFAFGGCALNRSRG